MALWILRLFIVALMPVLKVLLITAVGTVLAFKRVDLLGADARKHLNNLVFYVLNPALVGSILAKYTTSSSLIKLWFMPVGIVLTFVIGSALGWILIKVTKPPKKMQGLILGCCAAGNLGNMPLIIVPAVCNEQDSPFGDANTCYMRGLAYVSLSMAVASIILWSYVYNIVRSCSRMDSYETKLDALPEGTECAGETQENPSKCHSGSMLPVQDKSVVPVEHFELDGKESEKKVMFPEKIKTSLQIVIKKLNLKKLFSPSTNAALIGFVIGIIPPFRKALIGNNAPFHVIEDSADYLGQAAIPMITLIVGANLVKGFKRSKVPLSVIIGILIVRYILLPIVGVGIIKFSVHFGFLDRDPLYLFVLLLQFALPPAINIGTMVQLFGAGESECSVIMLWTYCLASIAMTLWSAFFLWLVK